MTVARSGLWLAEGLAGIYRVDPRTNRVAARLRVRVPNGTLTAEQAFSGRGEILVTGAKSFGTVVTLRYGLARVDPSRKRVLGVTSLPSGPPGALAATFGNGSLWVARFDGSRVERIDPTTGEVTGQLRGHIGMALAVVAGRVWTAFANGTIAPLGPAS